MRAARWWWWARQLTYDQRRPRPALPLSLPRTNAPTHKVEGSGRSQKEAQAACALEMCRVLSAKGMLKRQVSAKQRKKGRKKKKKKKGGLSMQQQLNQVPAAPFVLPFKPPVFNGANPAKKMKILGKGIVPNVTFNGTPPKAPCFAPLPRQPSALPCPASTPHVTCTVPAIMRPQFLRVTHSLTPDRPSRSRALLCPLLKDPASPH